ncbi:hypothetical protein Moror_1327, partial [Moniliophthora roreri MCA 2997]
RQKEIKKDMDDLNKEFEVRCAALAKKWKRKEHYVKDMFFQEGKFVKAQNLRESGIVGLNTVQIAKWYHKEYQHLKRPENQALLCQIIHKYKKYAKWLAYQRIKLPTARGCAQDFANTASQMTKMLTSTKKCISLEEFFVLVCNHTQGSTAPKWYFSHPDIEPYLKVILRGWDTDAVGFKLKAFTVAGCRPENMASNSDNKLKALKYRIHKTTRQRLNGLDKGAIGFKHLDPDELKQWKEEYVEKMRNLEEAEGREGDAKKSTGKKAKGTKKTSATKKTPAAASKSARKKAPPAERLAPPMSSSSSTSSFNLDSSKSEREPQAKPKSKPKQVLKRKKLANKEEELEHDDNAALEITGRPRPRQISTSTPGPNTTNNGPDTSCSTPPTGSPLFLPEDNPQSPT